VKERLEGNISSNHHLRCSSGAVGPLVLSGNGVSARRSSCFSSTCSSDCAATKQRLYQRRCAAFMGKEFLFDKLHNSFLYLTFVTYQHW